MPFLSFQLRFFKRSLSQLNYFSLTQIYFEVLATPMYSCSQVYYFAFQPVIWRLPKMSLTFLVLKTRFVEVPLFFYFSSEFLILFLQYALTIAQECLTVINAYLGQAHLLLVIENQDQ